MALLTSSWRSLAGFHYAVNNVIITARAAAFSVVWETQFLAIQVQVQVMIFLLAERSL